MSDAQAFTYAVEVLPDGRALRVTVACGPLSQSFLVPAEHVEACAGKLAQSGRVASAIRAALLPTIEEVVPGLKLRAVRPAVGSEE